jgi:hypothetical protein
MQPAALVALITASAASVLSAGCGGPQTGLNAQSPLVNDSLDSVEIDDSPVSLPRTRLVTCVSVPPNGYLFTWTGSNKIVPRRPLEEAKRSSRVAIRFDVDPPAVKTLYLRLYFRGDQLLMRVPSDRSVGPMSITSSGQDRYVLVGMIGNQLSPQEPPRHQRVELQC